MTAPQERPSRILRGGEPEFEVGQDVLDQLDADAQAHEVRRDAGGDLPSTG